MSWTAADAEGHTKLASTAKLKREWADIANDVLERTGDEGRAIRAANARIHEHKARDPAMRLMRGKG